MTSGHSSWSGMCTTTFLFFCFFSQISKKTLRSENDCQAKNKQHYKKCEICSSYHVFEVLVLLQ
jgi:hypothetical protein